MNKQNYMNAMNSITPSEKFLTETSELMKAARESVPEKTKTFRFNYKIAAVAACGVLVIGIGAFALGTGLSTSGMKSPDAAMETVAAAEGAAMAEGPEELKNSDVADSGGKTGIKNENSCETFQQEQTQNAITNFDISQAAGEYNKNQASVQAGEQQDENAVPAPAPASVTLTYRDSNTILEGTEKIEFMIINKSDTETGFGYDYKLEKMTDGTWEWVNEDMMFIEMWTLLPPNTSEVFSVSTAYLEAGEYKMTKQLSGSTISLTFTVLTEEEYNDPSRTVTVEIID